MSEPEAIDENPEAAAAFELMRERDPATGRIPAGVRRAELAFAAALPKHDLDVASKHAGRALAGDYTWVARGPRNIGGRTRALAIDRSNNDVMLAGGVTGGMWRSSDHGTTWARTTSHGDIPSVTCVAQDPRPGRMHMWYYGTGEFRTNSNRFGNVGQLGDGIFRSSDSGHTWAQLPATVSSTPQVLDSPFDLVNAITVDGSSVQPSAVYAAVVGAIMRSTDEGTTWQTVLGTPGSLPGFTTIAISPLGVRYAGFGSGGAVSGVMRSADGVTWSNITPPGWGDSCRGIVLAIAPSNEKVLYVLAQTPGRGLPVQGSYGFTEDYSLWKYTYVSGDGTGAGGVWSDRSFNLPQTAGPLMYNGLHSYALALAVDPRMENRLFVGGSNLYFSDDGMASVGAERWLGGYDSIGNFGYEGSLHPDMHALIFDPLNPDIIYAATDGGVFALFDPSSGPPNWTPLNSGYVTGQFYSIALDPGTDGSTLIMGGLQDNGTPLTPGDPTTWNLMFGGDGSFCAIAPGGNSLYVSSQFARMYRLQRFSDSTFFYTRIDPTDGRGYLFINPFTLDPSDSNTLYLAGGRRIWRNDHVTEIPLGSNETTIDGWERLDLTDMGDTVSAIGVSTQAPAHRVYYGTVGGHVYRLDSATSADHRPVDVTGSTFPKGIYINCVAVDPLDGARAIAVATNYNVQSLFLTTDAGATWTAIGGNLEEFPDGKGRGPSCRWATFVHRGTGTYVFVGTTTGLYSTTKLDGAATMWTQEGPGSIGYVRVDMIAGRQTDGMVAVGTWGNGAFSAQLPTLGVHDGDAASTALRLDEPVPNPMGASATISFALPASPHGGVVRLGLYDVLGREVMNLTDRPLDGGEHRLKLDAGALPAGTYYLRLKCGEASRTRKVAVWR